MPEEDAFNLEVEEGEEEVAPNRNFKRKGTMAGKSMKQKNYLHTSQPMVVNGKRKMTVVKGGIHVSNDVNDSDLFDEQ